MPRLLDRIGVDVNQKLPLERAIAWAIEHKVPYIDLCLDQTPELLEKGSPRLASARRHLEANGIQLGLHTLSAVNIAETSPFVTSAADAYLAAYLDAASKLGAGWIVVHGGYHFGSDKKPRMDAAVERISKACRAAERKGVRLLLENLNPEPEQAEVHYLCADLEECKYYFDRLDSPALGWSFTVNHAHIRPNRIEDFMQTLDLERCGEVRIADCRGTHEEHLKPGEGTIDFPAMFAAIEKSGYRGHYMQAFGSLDDMLWGRDTLAALAEKGSRQ
ncbi:MAG TPA: sugar phosphate isomerase/epimerase family protein [Burkholderiales bacterium]